MRKQLLQHQQQIREEVIKKNMKKKIFNTNNKKIPN